MGETLVERSGMSEPARLVERPERPEHDRIARRARIIAPIVLSNSTGRFPEAALSRQNAIRR